MVSENQVLETRSVLPDDKPLALGVTSLLTRGLGVIPSQILFAAVFDSSCLHWSAGQCDKGFCQIYDNRVLRTRFFGILLLLRVLSVIGVSIAYIKVRRERVKRSIGFVSVSDA